MATLAEARAYVAALEQIAGGATEEVTLTTDAGTTRVSYTPDVLKRLAFWRNEVTRLENIAAGRSTGPALASFYD